jgi:hypothetical protein
MVDKRRQRGQSLVEFVILLPILLIVVSGVLDLGRLYYSYVAVTDAAGEGAAYGALAPSDVGEIFQRAQHASGGLVRLESDKVQVNCPSCPGAASGDPITVTVSYDFTLVTPLLNVIVPEGVLTLTAVAEEVILVGEV